MTDAPVELRPASSAPPQPAPRPWLTAAELRHGAVVVGVLAAVGAVLGLVWQWWSPPGPLAGVLPGHHIQPDETEAWIAADGRYAAITGAVGLVAGVALWFRRALRGPAAIAALGLGCFAGALLTEYVGRWSDTGRADGAVHSLISHLRLDVHMRGLRVVEPLVAILVYSLIVAFAPTDDLGRPEVIEATDVTDQPLAVDGADPITWAGPADSIQSGRHAQDAGRDGDAAGGLQQPQFPAQDRYGEP